MNEDDYLTPEERRQLRQWLRREEARRQREAQEKAGRLTKMLRGKYGA